MPCIAQYRGPHDPRDKAAMKLEIVAHCWNYSRLLALQLSSLALHPASWLEWSITVFCASDDEDRNTNRIIEFFREQLPPDSLHRWQLPINRLMRRAIGRNLAAEHTAADWVWFTDCDYLFGAGCLDSLADLLAGDAEGTATTLPIGNLIFPRTVLSSWEYGDGEAEIRRVDPLRPAVVPVDWSYLVPRQQSRAIGGIQIVRGDTCRSIGYLPGHVRYQKDAERWQRCHEDKAFRAAIGTDGVAVPIQNVGRIRHSVSGWEQTGIQW